ncbi:MAG: DUF2304 family protein [Planctomycetes bacterium]|jgi:hypothetical protein|nr:DUF2304 family protein [Planctomycetota bacterium]
MVQQIIASIVILFFLVRLFSQKRQKTVSQGEFFFWLVFWLFSFILVLSLRFLDKIVSAFGFSGSGIDVALYLSVAVLFYLIFRIRLRQEKIEKNITAIVRHLALSDNDSKDGQARK